MGEDHPRIDVTVDLVALAEVDGDPAVLLVRRGNPPFEGRWALPGGYLEVAEDLVTGALRELEEETGASLSSESVVQLGAYGEPDRDPRNRTVSVAFLAELEEAVASRGGSDAAEATWRPLSDALAPGAQLAFDHAAILRDGVSRSRWSASVPSPHADPG